MNTQTMHATILLTVWLLVLALTALFAALDAALGSLGMKEVMESDDADHLTANRWLRSAPMIRASITVWHTLLLIAAVAVSMVATGFITAVLPIGSRVPGLIVAGLVVLVVAELTPRYVGAQYAELLAVRLTGFLYAWSLATRFITRVILAAACTCARLFRVHATVLEPFTNEGEGSPLSERGDEDDALEPEEHEMIRSIFDFGDTVVREVMTPRTEMVAIGSDMQVNEAIATAVKHGHSRVPVYGDDIDHVVGIFYVRDALQYWDARNGAHPVEIAELMRTAFFVPETKRISELLREFRATKVQMAIIVDEYGGTAGLATLEDLVEEIVGEIQDEYDDDEEVEYRQIDAATFEVDAGMSVWDVNELLNISLPKEEDFDTLGGYIMYRLGHLPQEGETIDEAEFSLRILRVVDRRIEQVQITRHSGAPTETNE